MNSDSVKRGMSTSSRSIAAQPLPWGEFIERSEYGFSPTSPMQNRDNTVAAHPENVVAQICEFFRECWRDMKIMQRTFQQSQSGNGAQSQERNAARAHERKAWSRMADD